MRISALRGYPNAGATHVKACGDATAIIEEDEIGEGLELGDVGRQCWKSIPYQMVSRSHVIVGLLAMKLRGPDRRCFCTPRTC